MTLITKGIKTYPAWILLGLYHGLKDWMTLITNREYVDIYLKLKDKFKAVTKYEYLFEFKYIKANDAVTDEKINTLKMLLIKKLQVLEKIVFTW